MDKFINTILTEAGKIGKRAHKNILVKKDNKANWVTSADIAIEKYLINEIRSKYPSDFILTEESYSQLPKQIPSKMWIIDPLDGTTNATFGLPHYGISLAYCQNGEITNGAIYDIPNGQLYWAEKNIGAFKENIKLQIVDSCLKGQLVCTGFPYAYENYRKTSKYLDSIHKGGSRLIIVGSAVIASMYTVTNTFSIYYEYGLKIWDVAAASLIVGEAGGIIGNNKFLKTISHPDLFICGKPTAVKEFLKLDQ